jgi:steroid delta-isomerase-like uncharacterized protein
MKRTNLEIARSVSEEVWGKGNAALIDELYAENFVDLNPVPGIPNTRDGLKMQLAAFSQAFPDMNTTVNDIVAEGDKVVLRYTIRGTHTGDMMGVPPTGKSGEIAGITMLRLEDGKIVEEFSLADMMTLYQQLGLVPETAG